MNRYIDVVVYLFAALYLVLHGANGRWRAIVAFAVMAAALLVTGQPVWSSLLLSVLASHLVQLPRRISDVNITTPGLEGFANQSDGAKAPSDDKGDDDDDDDADDGDGDEKEGVDMFRTMLESYKSLTPDQVEHMTNDTKELIDTQKSLLETVKSLAPVVTQGKEMLDTFKDYFGNDTKDMLGAALKTIGGNEKKKGGRKR